MKTSVTKLQLSGFVYSISASVHIDKTIYTKVLTQIPMNEELTKEQSEA